MLDGCGMWVFESIFECQNRVGMHYMYYMCIGGVVCGEGLLAQNLASLLTLSLLEIPKCARIFLRVRGCVAIVIGLWFV